MRTTVSLDDDVAKEVQRIARVEGIGLSEALNRVARSGLARPRPKARYRQRSADLGIRIPVDDVAEVLELLDEA